MDKLRRFQVTFEPVKPKSFTVEVLQLDGEFSGNVKSKALAQAVKRWDAEANPCSTEITELV